MAQELEHPEIEKLKADQAEKLETKRREIAIRESLPLQLRDHVKSLFTQHGGEVWVTIQRHERYGYGHDAPKPYTLAEAVILVDSMDDMVSPVRVSVDGSTNTRAKYQSLVGEPKWFDAEWFRWYLRVDIHNEVEFVFHVLYKDTKLRINIKLGVGLAHKLRRGVFKEWRGMRQCERTDVVPHGGAKTIKWGGSGSSEYAQDVSFYPEDEAQLIASLEM
jgi:hypothetical protein